MKRKLAVLLACAMLITAAAPAESALAASGTTSTVKQQARTTVNKTVKTPQRGWYTLKNGQKRYFRNGKCLKGLQKIANRRYFFDIKTGVMKTNNVTYRRVLYYINEKGIVEGWKRGRNYYNSNGRRLSGDGISECKKSCIENYQQKNDAGAETESMFSLGNAISARRLETLCTGREILVCNVCQ